MKAYKFKLRNCKELSELEKYTDGTRFVWNHFMSEIDKLTGADVLKVERKKQLQDARGCKTKRKQVKKFFVRKITSLYRDHLKEIPSGYEISAALTQLKKEEGMEWLALTPADALQQKLKDFYAALMAGISGKDIKAIPDFKSRFRCINSFRIPVKPKVDGNKISIPKIKQQYKFHKSREIVGKMKNFTVKKEATGWFVSILCEIEESKEIHPSNEIIGLDMGVNVLAAFSDGSNVEKTELHKETFKKYEDRKKELQQELARRQQGGSNWKKTKNKLARFSHKIADARKDFLHKASNTITKNHGIIAIEGLNIESMVERVKGEGAGRQSKLSKDILDQGWYMFRSQLEYKAVWRGGFVKAVDPAGTSRTCNKCQYEDKANRLTQATFKCLSCGHTDNADTNAAKNIRDRAVSGGASSVVLAS